MSDLLSFPIDYSKLHGLSPTGTAGLCWGGSVEEDEAMTMGTDTSG